MFDDGFPLASPSGATILVRHRQAEGAPRGIVMVLHGLAEHSGRYARFAGDLASLGFHVYAHDHRGHGGTTAPDAPPRLFALKEGARKVLEDCAALEVHARETHPGLPLVVFGHSMGGILAASLAYTRGSTLAGVAIWNAGLDAGLALRLGRIALVAERALKGSDVSSGLFARLTFESWARTVVARRTDADWLSHDRDVVDAYLADPLCGWRPTISMAEDVRKLVEGGSAVTGIPPALPLHLLGGGEDPATGRGAAVERHAARLRRAGARDVTTLVIPGARHETLNEIETFRRPAMEALIAWLDRLARTLGRRRLLR